MSEFKALILSGTLKPKGKFSHTETLAGVLSEEMNRYDIESEIVRLNEYQIPPGVESKEGKNDQWPRILKKSLGVPDSHFCNAHLVGHSILPDSESD